MFSLTDKHLIEIEITGPFNEKLNQHFKCTTIRSNPSILGHVTGNQTYESFFNSLLGKQKLKLKLVFYIENLFIFNSFISRNNKR
jgi:hypothetical protein